MKKLATLTAVIVFGVAGGAMADSPSLLTLLFVPTGAVGCADNNPGDGVCDGASATIRTDAAYRVRVRGVGDADTYEVCFLADGIGPVSLGTVIVNSDGGKIQVQGDLVSDASLTSPEQLRSPRFDIYADESGIDPVAGCDDDLQFTTGTVVN